MGVEQQEGQQPSQQRPGEQSQLPDAPHHRHRRIKQRHRNRYRGGETIQAISNIHRIHRPHNDEGGDDHIHRPAQGQIHVQEGDVQVGGDLSLEAHQHQKQDGGGQLKQELLDGCQAQVLVALHLFIVIQKANDTEDGGKQEQVDMRKLPGHHPLPAHDHNGGGEAGDEHEAPHGGGPGLGGVPPGAHLPDFLTGLQPPQGGQDDPPAQYRRHGEAQHARDNDLHKYSPSRPIPVRRSSFVQRYTPPLLPARQDGAFHGL